MKISVSTLLKSQLSYRYVPVACRLPPHSPVLIQVHDITLPVVCHYHSLERVPLERKKEIRYYA